LLELMEEDGLVGPFVGAKAREVLMTLEEYQVRELAMAEELEALEAAGEGGDDAVEDADESPGENPDEDGDEDPEAPPFDADAVALGGRLAADDADADPDETAAAGAGDAADRTEAGRSGG